MVDVGLIIRRENVRCSEINRTIVFIHGASEILKEIHPVR